MLGNVVRVAGRFSRAIRSNAASQHCDAGSFSDQGFKGRSRLMSAGASVAAQESKTWGLNRAADQIVAAVVVERLPVVLPQLPKPVSDFKTYSFSWRQQYRRQCPQEFLNASSSKEDDGDMAFEPAPTVTEADTRDNRRSVQRSLNRRLYLILHGFPLGSSKDKPVWHFPEKQYTSEDTLRLCAESAVTSLVDNPSTDLYFIGNAPMGHVEQHCLQRDSPVPYFKRFFFKSQFFGNNLNLSGKHKDFAWVTKEELMDYLEEPKDKEFMMKLLPD